MPEKLLIIDDDEELLEFCVLALKGENYHVVTASRGDLGLRQLEKESFDLVLTDLMMPGTDGLAVVAGVRAKAPDTEIVMMTATPSLGSAIGALKSGAADYIIKPFDPDHLKAFVRRTLDTRNLRRELSSERALRQELEAAYRELQKVEELKESILARVSHEVRTPLTALRSGLEMLEPDLPPETFQKSLNVAREGAGRLQAVLEDLLTFLDLGRGPDVAAGEAVDVAALARGAVERLKPLWSAKKLSVSVELPADLPKVKGSAELLAKAFDHIVNNAVVFNRDGGSIKISASLREKELRVDVADTGEGIPEKEFSQIFDSFYQIANYLTRRVNGLGLGLSLTRRILEKHGGRISVFSKEGQGSTFTLVLPLA